MTKANLRRRDILKIGGAAALATVAKAALGAGTAEAGPGAALAEGLALEGTYAAGKYTLPELPYAYDALEPLYEQRTLRIHHDKHHAGYVKGLNAAVDKLAAARAAGELGEVKALSRDLAFNGSGHVLHSLFWRSMTPGGAGPDAAFAAALADRFGSVDAFTRQFAAAAKAVEASGWGVLAFEPLSARMLVLQAEKHQDLTAWGAVPLLVCDVWEHAYYLQYTSDRAAWVDNFMKLADWSFAGRRHAACRAIFG